MNVKKSFYIVSKNELIETVNLLFQLNSKFNKINNLI